MTRLNSRRRWRCAYTFIDLLVVLCIIAPACGATFWGCGQRTRCGGNRVTCASNLRQIGQAMLLYSNDNRGALPRVTFLKGDDPKPIWGTGASGKDPFVDAQANDVTAALFLLLRTQDITSEVFTCPSSNAEKDVYGGEGKMPIDRSNFTDLKKNLSYSMHNSYARNDVLKAGGKTYWSNALGAEFAVAADLSPGVLGTGDNVLTPHAASSAKDMKLGNTNNHDKDGQNVLYGDGHVAWEGNPFVGVNRDNIYTTGDGKIDASPVSVDDSVLMPTDD